MFWRIHRVDIAEESKSHDHFLLTKDFFSNIEYTTGMIIHELVGVGNGVFTDGQKDRIEFLARTPIVNKVYCPEHGGTFAVGLTQLLQRNTSVNKSHIVDVLNQFILAGCVDEDMIRGLVKYGTCHPSDQYAEDTVVMISRLLMKCEPGQPGKPNDSRVSAAIDAGVFEMCLSMLLDRPLSVQDSLIDQMLVLLDFAGSSSLSKIALYKRWIGDAFMGGCL